MTRVFVNITQQEQDMIRQFSNEVTAHHKRCGDKDRFVDKTKDPQETQYKGFLAEFAVCKHLGVPFKMELHQGGDLYDVDYRNCGIEVKYVEYGAILELRIDERHMNKPFTHAVLVQRIYKNEKWEIVGWTTRQIFETIPYDLTLATDRNMPVQRKYTKMYCMRQHNLEKPEYLINIIN